VEEARQYSVVSSPVKPTDPAEEAAQGRVALWLDPEDLRWLADQWLDPEDATQGEVERSSRIRFRAHAALHKAGLKETR
jgi:hypothetical protein